MPKVPFDEIDSYIEELDDYFDEPGDGFLDAPFVPSDETVVEAMLELAQVGPQDFLYDLGSGDGRILIAAARQRDARGLGIELDPQLVATAQRDARLLGLDDHVGFLEEDIFRIELRGATVVFLYLLQDVNLMLRHKLLAELRPGSRVVSQAFDMGDWLPDDWLQLGGTTLFKWIVPARVAGTWNWEGLDGTPFQVELKQKYQEVRGQAWRAGQQLPLERAELQGNRLKLAIADEEAERLHSFTLTFAEGKLQSVR